MTRAPGSGSRTTSIPVLLGRTLTTELPVLLKAALDDPEVTSARCAAARSSSPWPAC